MKQSITTTEQIEASPAQVWAFISNLKRVPEWVIGTKKMLFVSTSEVEVGTEYRELTQIGPSTSETTWRVTTFQAPRVQIHECHSTVMSVLLTMSVEPNGSGTLFTHRIDVTMLPALRPLGWLIEQLLSPRIAKDMRQTLQQAKQIVEREHSTVHI